MSQSPAETKDQPGHTGGVMEDMLDALRVADAAINPTDREGISLDVWNERLKRATAKIRAAIATATAQSSGSAACPICGKDTPHHHPSWEKNPAAWLCEIAQASSQKGDGPIAWFNWKPSLTFEKPNCPEGSIRNLRPLYHGEIIDTALSLARDAADRTVG